MCINVKEMEIDNYRYELIRSLEASHQILKATIGRFNNIDDNSNIPVSKKSLESFPLGVWIDLNDLVRVMKRANRFGDYLSFDTEMKKGGAFGEHFHDDIIESVEVISGELIDTSDSNKIYREGEIAHYDEGVKHTPISTKDTVLHVLFKPVKKN